VINLSSKNSKTIGSDIDETKEYHLRYFRAVNNPLRRKILRALKNGSKTINELETETRLTIEALNWHLSILKHGFCIEKKVVEGKIIFYITQEGKVVNYLDK
jgi:DNA-binding transcriptional ArsR family regulator